MFGSVILVEGVRVVLALISSKMKSCLFKLWMKG